MHERPQLHEAILERGTSQEQTTLAVKVEESLPSLALEVLDVLGLREKI